MSEYAVGREEDLNVTHRHDVYPFIDPQVHDDAQTYAGKVVLITGASRGIGLETAIYYVRAGASVTIIARKQETLDVSKAIILREKPSAQVLAFTADVRDVKKAEEAVAATVARFGRLDILVANAAITRSMTAPFVSKDPLGWWEVLEVNLRGVYNFIHFSVPELVNTGGQIVVLTSVAAQYRAPFATEYFLSKHALNRLAELVVVENPSIRIFCVHPGLIATQLLAEIAPPDPAEDTLALAAATILYLTSGKADYLSSRFVSATWDLEEVDRDWKEKIVSQNALVNKLSIPQ
ncbi:NAD-P-binding protein [Russula compacta]|nr:NAD-P-binding protein [Russula compacta]